MRYFDTHCHLDFEVFDVDLESMINECHELGVDKVLIPGTRASAISKLLALSKQYQGVYVAFGIHPFFVNDTSLDDLEKIEAAIQSQRDNPVLVALGEIGLDKLCGVDYQLQLQVFEKQLALAEQYSLPVILHNRKSDQLMLETLRRYELIGGVVHGFSGSYETAQQFIRMRFKIGVGGVMTWDNAHKVRAMIRRLSVDAIVLETDSPDMSPQWCKGDRNTPREIPALARYLASLKEMDEVLLNERLYQNACELFLKKAS